MIVYQEPYPERARTFSSMASWAVAIMLTVALVVVGLCVAGVLR